MNDVTNALKKAEVTTLHRLAESGLSKNKLINSNIESNSNTNLSQIKCVNSEHQSYSVKKSNKSCMRIKIKKYITADNK